MQNPRILAVAAVAVTALALALVTPQAAFAQWVSPNSFKPGVQPGAIAVDSTTNTVYVGGYDGRGIRALNGTTHKVLATYKSVHSGNVVQDLATDTVNHYVAAADHNGLMLVNETTRTVHETAWAYDANGVAFDPSAGLVFIGGSDENGNDYVSSFNESTGALVHTAAVTIGIGEIAVDTATHKVYVVGYNTGEISVINESTFGVSTISAASGECSSSTGGCGPDGIAVNSVTGMLYVSNNEPDSGPTFISVINTANGSIVKEIPVFTLAAQSLDDPGYMAVNAVTNTVYSVDYGPALVIDGATNTVTKAVPLGAHSWDVQGGTIAVNSATGVAYVASGQSSSGVVYTVADIPLKLATTTPKIVGHPKVNGVLSVTTGKWTTGTAFAYQWKVNGIAVTGNGTGTSYTVLPADVGKRITVSVTGSQTGYATRTVTSAASGRVASAPFATDPIPTIGGTLAVGSPLTATASGWSPAATFSYQWYRSGHAIKHATLVTYSLTAADRGKKITVRVVGHALGYTNTAKVSVATAKIGFGTLATVTPSISGTAAVGAKLAVVPGTWGPAKVTLSYTWYLNGKAINGAARATLTVPKSAAGGVITVAVRGTKSGYTAQRLTSAGLNIPA